MSLHIYLNQIQPVSVFDANITHNLNRMAMEAGIYQQVWRPEECPEIQTAKDLIPHLERGIVELRSSPEKYLAFNPENGWGDYDGFVAWLERYLAACREFPDSTIETCR
jgi:hypothetical protein